MADRPIWLTDADIARITAGRNPSDQVPIIPPIISPETERVMLEGLNLHLTPQEAQISASIRGRLLENPLSLAEKMSREVFAYLKSSHRAVYTPLVNWIRSSSNSNTRTENALIMSTALVLKMCSLEFGDVFWDRFGELDPGDLLRVLEGTQANQQNHKGHMSIIDCVERDTQIPAYQASLRSCVNGLYEWMSSPYNETFVNGVASMHKAIEHFWPQLSISDQL